MLHLFETIAELRFDISSDEFKFILEFLNQKNNLSPQEVFENLCRTQRWQPPAEDNQITGVELKETYAEVCRKSGIPAGMVIYVDANTGKGCVNIFRLGGTTKEDPSGNP